MIIMHTIEKEIDSAKHNCFLLDTFNRMVIKFIYFQSLNRNKNTILHATFIFKESFELLEMQGLP